MKLNIKTLLFVLIPIVLLLGITLRNDKFKDIDNNKESGIGKVFRIRHIPKKVDKRIFEYEFKVNDKKYFGETRGYFFDKINVGDFFESRVFIQKP